MTHTPNAEKVCEMAARNCYNSLDNMTPDSHRSLLPGLLKKGHLSIVEHASITFAITGVSRALTHQLVRHRLASFSQQSQRYVNQEDFNYVIPPSIEDDEFERIRYINTMKRINEVYKDIISKSSIKKEDARFLLPNSATTDIVVSANFREWLHIIDERVTRFAQWEIRELLTRIWGLCYKIAPFIFGMEYFEAWGKDVDFKRVIHEKLDIIEDVNT